MHGSGKRKQEFQGSCENSPRKRGILRPGIGGLPAKPTFGNNQNYSANHDNSINRQNQSEDSTAMELFPGMIVNLPDNSMQNQNTVPNNQQQQQHPNPETLKVLSTLIVNLQQKNSPQAQVQPSADPVQNTYNTYIPQSHTNYTGLNMSQNNIQYNQNQSPGPAQQYNQYVQQYPNQQLQYNQQYPNQYGFNNYYNNVSNNVNNNVNGINSSNNFPAPQYDPQYQSYSNSPVNNQAATQNNTEQTQNAFMSLFSKFLLTQSQNQNQNQYNAVSQHKDQLHNQSHSNGATEKNENVINSQSINSKNKTKNKKQTKKVDKQKDISKDKDESDNEDPSDDEANWESKFAIQGTNIVFENDEDIQKWIEERKKNWPTNKRVEEKMKEIEKAKKIIDNINSNNGNMQSNTNVKICSYWLKTGKCRNGDNCKFSHDKSQIASKNTNKGNMNNKLSKTNNISTKPLPNHKVKLVQGIPVQIPKRFTPLNNKGKSLHSLMVEGEQSRNENVELICLFEKLVNNGIIKQDWNLLKKKLKLDDESLNIN